MVTKLMTLAELEPFAVGFLEADRDDRGYRIAAGMKKYAEKVKLSIKPSEWFVGTADDYATLGIYVDRGFGLRYKRELCEERLVAYPEIYRELKLVYDYFRPLDSQTVTESFWSPVERKLRDGMVFWTNGAGHTNPDYEMYLKLGTEGLRNKIERFRKVHTDKEDFYDGLLLTIDALEIFAKRYKQLALSMLESASEEDAIALKRIIVGFENVPYREPRNFHEACLMFWLAFSSMNSMDSPGLFDLFMGPYYEKDDSVDRYECLKKIWVLFQGQLSGRRARAWNLCVGGSDEFGRDLSNALSYDILRVARECRMAVPNLTMRVHKGTPEDLWDSAVETIATGIGMPALYNDDCVCTALESIGIPAVDAHKYCMNGCNQIDIFGKSHMGLEDGEICIAKGLELALFNGRLCGEYDLLTMETGVSTEFRCFEDLLGAYYRQIEFIADMLVKLGNRIQAYYAENAPLPWISVLIQGCIEKGLDFKNRGPIYGHGQILTEGLPDTADSLAAIKYYIFEEKKYTMIQLLEALKANFVGFESLHKDFSSWHKFGNDMDDVDQIYAAITDHVYRYFRTKKTFRGGYFGVGCSTFVRAFQYGEAAGAMPNGKKREDKIFSESIGAVPGCDKEGPTALLNSVNKGNQYLATSGNVLQMKFSASLFESNLKRGAFKALVKAYFAQGGQTLQVNVLSQADLLDALEHPEKHENLIVRVGGYSDYFVLLTPELRENIVKRTWQGL